MFSGTIAENMRNVKPDASDAEMIDVLKLACAWDFVEKLPDGIHSKIKERGGGFSEGQAQRLSIARALLRHSPVLLLDEAASALDVATERRVLRVSCRMTIRASASLLHIGRRYCISADVFMQYGISSVSF